MNLHIRPLVAGAALAGWAALTGCGSDTDSASSTPQESLGTAQAAVFSSGDPTTVVTGSPLTRSPTCPNKKLPDQCGSWAGVELSASRSYWPPRSADDEHCLCAPIEFQIPASLPVTQGNAGVALAELSFRKTNGKTVHCLYQGDQKLSRGKLVGGTEYDLTLCSDLSKAGATVKADWFSLEVHGGNLLNGPTKVNVELGEPDVVDGVVQEQIFYSDDPRIPGAALYVPRGSAPAQQDFTLEVVRQVAVGTTIPNAGAGFKTAGFAVDVHATGVDAFNFTPVPGAACARIELPYDPQAIPAGQERRLQARQITSLAGIGTGASVLASAGPVTVDSVRRTATFCVDHLSYYVTGTATADATLTGAWIAEETLTACTTTAQCGAGRVCEANACYFNIFNTAPPALRPNTNHRLRLRFLNGGSAWTTGDLRLYSMTPRSTPIATLERSPWFPTLTTAYVQTYTGAEVASSSSLAFEVPVRTPTQENAYSPNPYGSILNLCLRLGSTWLGECFSFDYPLHGPLNNGTGRADLFEVCDNIDNDGVGGVDDGPNACGGICTLTNPLNSVCNNGELGVCRIDGRYGCAGPNATACSAGSGAANAGVEVCNELDDDCDGETNEGGVCQICTPGAVQCVGNGGTTKQTCSADGLSWADNGVVLGECGAECTVDVSCGECGNGVLRCTNNKWGACEGGGKVDYYADSDEDDWCATTAISACESQRPAKTRTRAECVDSTWGFRSDCLDTNGFVQNGCCEKRIYSEMYYKDCCGGPETRIIDYDCGPGWHTEYCSLNRVEGFGKTSKYFMIEECGEPGQRFGRMSVYYALDFLEGVEGNGVVHCVPDGLDTQPSYCPVL